MLKIEIRKPPEGVCPNCLGTGIVIPKKGEMPITVGEFCTNCDEGNRRWTETTKTIDSIDSVPPKVGRVE
ncbi:MAG TPA: hypothetical protein VEZ90_02725 [Blastocatellia bacterium]|nr:hypothetical protein [Blastocatellia bacterium]